MIKNSTRRDLERCRPARYFPFANGRYEVKAGLHRLGTDFGNGEAEPRVFQLDCQFERYRFAKLNARADRLGQYHLTDRYPESAGQAVTGFIARQLATEYPLWFELSRTGSCWRLACALTGEILAFNQNWQWQPESSHVTATPPYRSSLDALASQIQEDLAIMCVEGSSHWLAALHVCLPGHWAPESKIGKTFAAIHAPVPQMEALNARQQDYVDQMIYAQGGMVRFVWGCQFNDRLNGHPESIGGANPTASLQFDAGQTFVRVERQVIWGFSQAAATLFVIRPYLMEIEAIRANVEYRQALTSALRSMGADALAYKGITCRDALVNWLENPP